MYTSYVHRHKPVILNTYDASLVPDLYKYLKKFVVHPDPMTFDEYIESMDTPGKRKFYRDNYEFMQHLGRYKTGVVQFNKIEKMGIDLAPESGVLTAKPGRLIQARHPTFNLMFGRYIKAIEYQMARDPFLAGFFGKGNYDQVAAKIEKLRAKYSHYTEVDHRSFDAHVTRALLKLSHKFYEACFPWSSELRELCRAQLRNRCESRHGNKYTTDGTRQSGDVDTSLGNSLVNYAILKYCLHKLGLKGEVIVCGDDSIIFTNEPINLDRFRELCAQLNMETVVKPSTTNIHQVDFCQCRFVYNSTGKPTMMKNPERLNDIFGMAYGCKPRDYGRYLSEIAYCNAMMNKSSDLGRAWAEAFGVDTTKTRELKYIDRQMRYEMLRINDSPLDVGGPTTSYYEAYPDYDEQVARVYLIGKLVAQKKYTTSLTVPYNVTICHEAKYFSIY